MIMFFCLVFYLRTSRYEIQSKKNLIFNFNYAFPENLHVKFKDIPKFKTY